MREDHASEVDVLIIGAGPTGLTLACELHKRGVCYRLLEQKAAMATTSRAVALHSRTLEIFSALGVIEQIVARSSPIVGVDIYHREYFLMQLELRHSITTPHPHVLLLPQNEIEQVLCEYLAQIGGTLELSRELLAFHQGEDGVLLAQVRDASGAIEEIRTRWLIGCDGSHSRVRRELNLPFVGHALAEEFLLMDAEADWLRSRDTTCAWLHQEGLFAALPLPQRRQWRIFANIATPLDQDAPPASVELFQKLLQERTGDMQTTLSNPVWLANFRIHERQVMHYRQGSVFLAGDAAHIHSPFGGQGMNLGIQDSYNLAWKLALVVHGQGAIYLLDTYEQERKPIAHRVLRDTHLLTNILIGRSIGWHFIRDQVVVRLFKLRWIQRLLARRGSELEITYRSSPLTQRSFFSWKKKPRPGSRSPQFHFRLASNGANATLCDLLQEPAGLLLLFAGTQSTADYTRLLDLASLFNKYLEHSVRVSLVLPQGERPADSPWSGEILLDYRNDLYQLYGGRKATMCFIRPDGYIGLQGQLNEKQLWSYLGRILTLPENMSQ